MVNARRIHLRNCVVGAIFRPLEGVFLHINR